MVRLKKHVEVELTNRTCDLDESRESCRFTCITDVLHSGQIMEIGSTFSQLKSVKKDISDMQRVSKLTFLTRICVNNDILKLNCGKVKSRSSINLISQNNVIKSE